MLLANTQERGRVFVMERNPSPIDWGCCYYIKCIVHVLNFIKGSSQKKILKRGLFFSSKHVCGFSVAISMFIAIILCIVRKCMRSQLYIVLRPNLTESLYHSMYGLPGCQSTALSQRNIQILFLK